ncbi:MAG: TonB family protein, partial [Candidatus Omnitrophota bacterium]
MRIGWIGLQRLSLGKAVFLSVLWHLFWLSSISIVNVPVEVQYPRFADISFFGALWDEPNFEVHVAQRPISRSYPAIPQERISRFPFQEFPEGKAALFKVALPYSRKWGAPGEFLGLRKKNPAPAPEEHELLKKESPVLKGPLGSRILYYQPPLPEIPRWIDPQEAGSSLELRFWVSPEGKVIGIEKITSSGDPTLDAIGMRYLRRWQFNPKTADGEEWGETIIRFPLS